MEAAKAQNWAVEPQKRKRFDPEFSWIFTIQRIIPYNFNYLDVKISISYINNGFVYNVHSAGLLDVHIVLSADTGISLQTEGHLFGDHLISGSVSIIPSSVIEGSIVVCSVSLGFVWANVQSACALNTRYNNPLIKKTWRLIWDYYIHYVFFV
jgi:hypothetical protein